MAVKEITGEQFKREVLECNMPVFVDFWAPWCGPCRMLGPIVEELSGEHNEVKFVKINVDENIALAEKYGIDAIPALAVFKNGNISARSVGYQDKESLAALLN